MTKNSSRFGYIDLLRGWAVIVMIETHVVNAFLYPLYRENKIFSLINFMNGIVAPAFLFLAGYSFMIMLNKKREQIYLWSPVFRKTFFKLIGILFVAYLLRIPYFSFERIMNGVDDKLLSNFLKVDILHCISITMMLMLFNASIIKNQKIFIRIILGLLVAFLSLTGFMWSTNMQNYLPLGIANYLNASQGSLFPLFPWSSFIFIGALASNVWLEFREKKKEDKYFKTLISSGLIMAICGLSYQYLSQSVNDTLYWRISPMFFITRIGVVFILLSLFWYWQKIFGDKKSAVLISGNESLLLYTLHLLVIYGMFFDEESLAFIINKTLLPNEVMIFSIILILVMIVTAILWSKIKNRSSRLSAIIKGGIVLVSLLYFFTN